MNYLHNEVEWPIKTKFVIENLNLYEMQKLVSNAKVSE